MRCSLVFNISSGSYSADLCESLTDAVHRQGELTRVYRLPEDDLPKRKELEEQGVDIVAIYTGDGTINALVQQLGDWSGKILVLPGGTMNLLSRRLHGEAQALDILNKALAGKGTTGPIPIAKADGQQALVGVIAGPTSALGQVREHLRHFDLGGLTESIPGAWDQTFNGDRVWLDSDSDIDADGAAYPAIYAEATEPGIRMLGFTATSISEIVGHGLAWLRGDFREGPRDELGTCKNCAIKSSATRIGLLVDGEQAEADAPLKVEWGLSRLDFIATIDNRAGP